MNVTGESSMAGKMQNMMMMQMMQMMLGMYGNQYMFMSMMDTTRMPLIDDSPLGPPDAGLRPYPDIDPRAFFMVGRTFPPQEIPDRSIYDLYMSPRAPYKPAPEFVRPHIYPRFHNPNDDAQGIYNAVTGVGTDEAGVFNALEGRNPREIADLRQAYRDRYGVDLGARLRDDLNREEMHRASSAMNGQDAANAAGDIDRAVAGIGTDEEAVYRSLEGKTPDEIARVRQAYRDQHGVELGARLRDDLNSEEMHRASALMNGQAAANTA